MSMRSLWEWLWRKAPETDRAALIARLMSHLNSPDPRTRRYAENLFQGRIIHNMHGDYDAEFIEDVLRAVAEEGSPRLIPYVAQLANGQTQTAGAREREAAKACLARLEERAYAEKILLRGSEAPQAAPDTLLRPAEATGESKPEELLRADSV